jgi:maltose phosphorylase
VAQGQNHLFRKLVGYTVSLNHENTVTRCQKKYTIRFTLGYDQLLQDQIDAWAKFGKCQILPLMAM